MCRMLFTCVFLTVFTFSPKGFSAQDCQGLWVNPGESIQAKIDVAPPGSIICLPEGTWSENLVINKSLTLRGQGPGRTIIRLRPQDFTFSSIISVRGPLNGSHISVVIEGLTLIGALEHPVFEILSPVGLFAHGMAQVVIRNCQILEVHTGSGC